MKDFLSATDDFVTALENGKVDATATGTNALRELADYIDGNPTRGTADHARKCVDLMDRCNKVGTAIVPPTPGSIPYTVPGGSSIPGVIPFGIPNKPSQTILLQCVMLGMAELLKTLPPASAPGSVEANNDDDDRDRSKELNLKSTAFDKQSPHQQVQQKPPTGPIPPVPPKK